MAYIPAMRAGFIWDDDLFLTENPLIQADDGLYRFWCTTQPPDYFPLTSTMLWLEWRLWGQTAHPGGYHVVNILLHAASAVLLWRVLVRLGMPGALLAGLLFAVHPVNVESVAWITERKNVLPMVFYLLAILAYLRFEDEGRRRWYVLALGAFALGLLAKAAIVMLPLVLLGLAWWRRGRIARADLVRNVPFLLLALAAGLVTTWYQTHVAIGAEVVRDDGPLSRLAIAGRGVWFYLYKALLPVNLCFIYPRWPLNPAGPLAWAPLAALVAALAALAWIRRPWARAGLLAMGYYVLALLPALGFINIYFMKYSLVADHWQYFALPGVTAWAAAAAVWLGKRLPLRWARGMGVCGAGLLVGALAALTWEQSVTYESAEGLYRRTLERNPDCWMAHNNLGALLACSGRPDEAIAHYREALARIPNDAEANFNLGMLFFEKGHPDEAVRYFRQALRAKPNLPWARYCLGASLEKTGRLDEAIEQYQEAARLMPDMVQAHASLGSAWEARGRFPDAVRSYRTSLQLKPGQVEVCNNLAWLLATEGAAGASDPAEAIELAERACRLAGGKPDAARLDTLAASYARAGRFDEAQATARRAIELAVASGPDSLVREIRERLELYRSGRPYRRPQPASLPGRPGKPAP